MHGAEEEDMHGGEEEDMHAMTPGEEEYEYEMEGDAEEEEMEEWTRKAKEGNSKCYHEDERASWKTTGEELSEEFKRRHRLSLKPPSQCELTKFAPNSTKSLMANLRKQKSEMAEKLDQYLVLRR